MLAALVAATLLLQAQAIGTSEAVRIGGSDAPESQFTSIRHAVQDAEGNLYLLLQREGEIRVFSPQGRFLRRIAHRGQGPGELMAPVAMGWRGDSLWVRDVQLNRVTVLGTDGAVFRTLLDRMPSLNRRYVPGPPAAMLADGALLGVGDAPSTMVSSGQITSVPVVRFAEGGGSYEHLRDLSLANLYGDQPPGPTQPGIHFQQRLSDATLWHVSHDGASVVFVDRTAAASPRESSFEITWYDASGSIQRQRRVTYSPIPLDRATRDSLVRLTLNPMGIPNVQMQSEVVFAPPFLPPVTEVHVATDRRLWLRREYTLSESAKWEVYDTQLRLVGTAYLPTDFRLLTAGRDHVWGWRADANDVPVVLRYNLR